MFNDHFFDKGEMVTLADVLCARESRATKQLELLISQKNCSLLSCTMNIPGPIKTNSLVEAIFEEMLEVINIHLKEYSPKETVYLSTKTGNEYYYLSVVNPRVLKKIMILIEEEHPYGRLFDLDVLWLDQEGNLATISRTEMGLSFRRCYVCTQDAKVCGRSRKHSLPEMKMAITNLLKKGSEQIYG